MPALPIAALLVLGTLGAGVAALGAGRFPLDAQAALAPLLGFSFLVVGSAAGRAGLDVRVLLIATLLVVLLVAIRMWRRIAPLLRAGGAPRAVAVVAIAVDRAPNLA